MKLALTRWASITLAVAMLWPSAPTLASDDSGKDSKSASKAEAQYQALVKEKESAEQEYFQALHQAYEKVKTDAARKKVAQNYPVPQQKYAGRFLDLAEKNPNDAAAIDALISVVQESPQGSDAEKALQILLERHMESDKLGIVCKRLTDSASSNAEKFLKAVVAKNPHPDVQGQALFSLAQYHKNRSELDQAEKLFEQVSDKYADLAGPSGTLGDGAKAALYELRNLAIGKVAPEIEGEDLDGKKFKLSDYRGKVVVIDFWGDW